MSVLASCHLPDGTWVFNIQPETPSPNIEIGFSCDQLPVTFDNLSFGFTISKDGATLADKSYPREGVRYVSTDQQYISNDRVDLAADDEVTLEVWMVNAGARFEATTLLIVPRPPQPFPSWVWDEGWSAPVPYPDDSEVYVWDEDSLSWVEVDDGSLRFS